MSLIVQSLVGIANTRAITQAIVGLELNGRNFKVPKQS
jgi:hypothetical protein